MRVVTTGCNDASQCHDATLFWLFFSSQVTSFKLRGVPSTLLSFLVLMFSSHATTKRQTLSSVLFSFLSMSYPRLICFVFSKKLWVEDELVATCPWNPALLVHYCIEWKLSLAYPSFVEFENDASFLVFDGSGNFILGPKMRRTGSEDSIKIYSLTIIGDH